MSRISTVICSSCGDRSFGDVVTKVAGEDDENVVNVDRGGQSQMKRSVILDFLATWGPVVSNYCHLSIVDPPSLVAMLLLLLLIQLFLEVMYLQLNRMNRNLPLKRELSMSLDNQVLVVAAVAAAGDGDGDVLSDWENSLDSVTHRSGRRDLDHPGKYFDLLLP